MKRNVTILSDFKGKVAGSVVENPNIAKNSINPSLQMPSSAIFNDLSSAAYSWIGKLDNTQFSPQTEANKYISQVLLSWNVIEIVERQYPTIFQGVSTVAEKVDILKGTSQQISLNAYGYASGAAGNSLKLSVFVDNNAWASGVAENTINSIKQLRLSWNTKSLISRIISDDGYIYALTYAPASDGTTPSIVTIDYASIEIVLPVSTTIGDVSSPCKLESLSSDTDYTAKVINKSGESNESTFTTGKKEPVEVIVSMDLKNKIAGSVIENPNRMTRTAYTNLLSPQAITIENDQNQYNGIMNLDNNLYSQSTNVNGNIFQVMFSWNVVENIEKQYPTIFQKAATVAEKVAKLKSLTKSINIKVHGFASGAGEKPNRMILARWGGIYSWVTGQASDATTVALLQGNLTSDAQINSSITDDGYVYVMAYAPASDGKTASIINIDYASLECTLSM
ncbi:hypothetical protein [Enterococcus sp. LJL51]|uniref:hypothetical protein n=1 Tax=Enterococcus sp. LJL51 TaxID=3416656 RepID=UPI003CF847EA